MLKESTMASDSHRDVGRAFELIIARAVMDADFRYRVLSDKPSVATEYGLTGGDLEALKRVDAAQLESARGLADMIPVVHLRSEGQTDKPA
jgi:hypothetical protein